MLSSAAPGQQVQQAPQGEFEEQRETSIYYTTARVNMRAGPSTKADIVAKIDVGEPVLSFGVQSRWHSVRYGHLDGWIHADLLTAREPVPPAPPAARTTPSPRYSAFSDGGGGGGGGGGPTRQPYTGRCECPYDLMKNGRACGGRSAYSRPGGHKPRCYD